MGEDHDGRLTGKARQIFLQPRKLFAANFRFAPRNVVKRHEMHAAVVEGVISVAKVLAIKLATIQPGVVFAGNVHDLAGVHVAGNLLELLHAPSVDIFVLAVMGQVTGEQHQLGFVGQLVNQFHCALKGLGSQRIGRAVESHVRVGKLQEGEGGHLLAGFATAEIQYFVQPWGRAKRR